MSVKRTKDPAGLLGDRVRIDFTDDKPVDAGDLAAVTAWLTGLSPRGRINALLAYPDLRGRAEELLAELQENGGSMDAALEVRILQAEQAALYIRAFPAAVEKRKRDHARRKHSNAVIDAALRSCNGNRTQAGKSLNPTMTPRQIRHRIQTEDELAHWRKS